MASVKRVIDPTTWVNRQITTLSSVGRTNYEAGIASPHKDPIEAGIAAEPKYADAIQKAVSEKRRAAALGKTNMAQWYAKAKDLGAGRLVEGVTKRRDKVEAFVTAWTPLLTTHLGNVDRLADVTDGDRENKVLANLRGLKALKGKA